MDPRLRALPAVDQLAAQLLDGHSLAEATSVARSVLEARRKELLGGATDDADLLARARDQLHGGPRRVLNGTGVIIHTNLGRAPLPESAVQALSTTAGGYA
ncbi:MAG: hypothetical protein J2O48_08550, partial [Solirubrobacterales bacterium]|nr:hypothetical protein [Solirubrobacterales bacterium]